MTESDTRRVDGSRRTSLPVVSDGVAGPSAPAPMTGADIPRVRGAAAGLFGSEEELDAETRAERFSRMREGTIGSVHSWELVTAVDGPGTRMTLFLSGCPLRCVYCHNPDTMRMADGTLQTLEDVVARIKRYRRVFQATGGGVTVSGGEAMFQMAFLRRIMAACREMGVHTAVDTSGYLGAKADDALIDDVDLFLLDVKSGSEDVYKPLTGRELQPTIDFGDRLEAKGKQIWVRFVAVPGWTDSVENVENVADIVSRWPNAVQRVEVLPFHNMGQDKWDNLGMEYQLRDVGPPDKDTVERIREQFRSRGIATY